VNGAVLSPSGQFALPAGGSSDKSAGLDQKGALGWGRFFVGADHARLRAFNQQGGLRPIVGQTQELLPLLFGPSPGGPPEAISHLPRASTAACGATRARQSELRRSERWRPPARRRTDVLWLDREAPSTSPPPMAPQVAHGKRGHLLILAPILLRGPLAGRSPFHNLSLCECIRAGVWCPLKMAPNEPFELRQLMSAVRGNVLQNSH